MKFDHLTRKPAKPNPILFTICLFATIPWGAKAQSKWAGNVETTVVSAYLYRGSKFGGASVQPSAIATYDNKFTVGVWGSYAFEKIQPNIFNPVEDSYNETDLLANYAFNTDKYTVILGGTLYTADNLRDGEGKYFDHYFETYFAFSLKHKLNPGISYWRETGRLSGNYIELSINPSFPLNERASIGIRSYIGLLASSADFFTERDEYYGTDVTLSYDLGKKFYLRGNVTFIRTTTRGLRSKNRIVPGITVGRRW